MEDTSPGTHMFYSSDSRGSVIEIRLTDTTMDLVYCGLGFQCLSIMINCFTNVLKVF